MRRITAPVGLILVTALVLAPVVGATAVPLQAAAQLDDPPAITWSVEPTDTDGQDDRASFAYAVDPGTQIRDYVAITNFGDDATTFKLYATDAINDFDTGAFGLLPSEEAPVDTGSWITLGEKSVTIQPGSSVLVPITLLVPSDASPGDHTAGVIASFTTKSTDDKGAAINLEQRVAARVYLRVAGDPVAKVEATGLTAGYTPEWNPFGGGTGGVDYAVSNTGNVRVDVTQKVVFTGPFGIPLGEVKPEPVVNLLPGQAAHVHAETSGIAPLVLLFGGVTLTPKAPTDTVAESAERTAAGAPAEPRPKVEYTSTTADTITGAISWTLLALVVLAALLIWFVVRYVRATQERMWDAIDEATENARLEAQREAEEPVDAPVEEPVR